MMSGILAEDTHELLNELDALWKELVAKGQDTPVRGQRLNEPLERLNALIDANDVDAFRRAALHLYSVMDMVAKDGGVRLTGAGNETVPSAGTSSETVPPSNSMNEITVKRDIDLVRSKLPPAPPAQNKPVK